MPVVRKIDGVLGDEAGAIDESFYDGLLEYPQYTRPASFRGMDVPAVLLSGNHAAVERWRREMSLERTARLRPDLLASANLDASDRTFLGSLGIGGEGWARDDPGFPSHRFACGSIGGPLMAGKQAFMDAGRHARPDRPSLLKGLASFVATIAIALGISWFLMTFVIHSYEVPSGSMETTIITGDKVISEKVSYYFRNVEPGDIVTFDDKEIPGRMLLKRCIAVGGQTVDLVDGKVYVDGVALSEPYTHRVPSDRSRARS